MTLRLSQVRGDDSPALLEHTIGGALQIAAERWPQSQAVVSVHQSVHLNYAELHARVVRFAAGLHAIGLGPGDRVGIWAPNCVEWVIAQLATARMGAILVTINPAYRVSELSYTLRKVGVRILICADRFKSSDYLAMVEELIPELKHAGGVESAQYPLLRTLVKIGGSSRCGWLDFDAVESARSDGDIAAVERIAAEVRCTEAVNIQFTSGTTGRPKGATLSHRNILNNGYFVGRAIGLRHEDRLCIPVPLYHCFGMVMANLACIAHGATMVFPSAAFDPVAVLRTLESERCTALYGVPTMFIAELDHPEFRTFDLSSLRTGIMAGSPCPIEIMRRVVAEMNLRDITIAYGMTETSPVSFQSCIEDSIKRRVSTVGRVQPHLECKVVDSDGNVAAVGVPGELCTRGYSVMLGYWDDPQQTADAIDSHGWMHTGDLAIIDAEGYCNIVGRIKDMVIRGGENIYPRELEEFLYGHPKVQDVAVVGVPDDKFGEEICAWIVLKPGCSCRSEEITDFCEGQIAHYKVPRYVRFVDGLPLTITGKVQKFEIRRQMIERLSLTEQPTA